MAYRFKQNYYIKPECECGGTLRIKDHGSWVGYYCPKCKGGGSVQKHSKKRHFQQSNRNSNSAGLSAWSRPKAEPVNDNEFFENDEPMSLYEYCHKESGGLTGQALKDYINRYYGHN